MKRLLLFEPYGRLRHVAALADLFRLYPDWEVKKIGPGDRHGATPSQGIEPVVLLPDTKGINANGPAFARGGSKIPPNVPPQDQLLEYFLLNDMQWYVNKGTPVVGIGMSAFAIFGTLCRGNLTYGADGILPVDPNSKTYWPDEEHFISMSPLCGGYTGKVLDETLVTFVEDILYRRGNESELVKANQW